MRYCELVIIGLGAIALTGCPKRNEFAEPPPPTVSVQVVQPQTVTVYDSMPGQTAAAAIVDVVARVKGFLQSQDFEDGAQVAKDQLLFTIDPAEYQANFDAAQGKFSSAVASRDLADTTYKRNKELFATQAISELEMLQSEADLDLAKGGVEQAKAEVERAKLDLGYTKIKSPIDGQVSREFVSPGNLVGPGVSDALARVVSLDPMYFYFNVDERSFLKYQKLDRSLKAKDKDARIKVSLELADGGIYAHEGEVDYADNQVDSLTGTIEIRAVFPNPDRLLYPGLFGNLKFGNVRKDAIVVPEIVIQKDLAGDFVLVVGADNLVETRYVKKGARVEEGIILTEGLEADEKLIVNGIQRARPGMPVKIEDQATPKPE
ncbi:efflux RND transporter periplasmic adaptor subunit [Cerasicoccus frondis]|uniref:efflux RND transporter periplasmic adaptor subunit n=1 Tax=Cerasicoccus frondis TaxID=490090 RepID=UPI0028525706|nr:efflux RND transporter periplasmic adaptor subunit [Cerasicoccus frondis]